MIKKYVKGSSTNPEGVIKALEKLGGRNTNNLEGGCNDNYYFINSEGIIDCIGNMETSSCILTECFEEIQPAEFTPKVITSLDVTKWYFHMLREGHVIQFLDYNADIQNFPGGYKHDSGLTDYTHVRIDFGKWIPIAEAGINEVISISQN